MMNIGKKIGLEYGPPTRNAFGEALKEVGEENPNLVVLDGDFGNSTRTYHFRDAFPDRFFNLGIAESNLVGTASGMWAAGKDVLAASFACFLMANAYDQIRMSIAFPKANVKLVGSHSGISIGEDGPSQMAIEDIALSTALPNFTVIVPADDPSARAATHAMFEVEDPVYLRTGRPKVPVLYENGLDFTIGKAIQLRDGADLTLIACGLMVAVALEAAHSLSQDGIEARVLDMHTIKPIDAETVAKAAQETGAIVTVEEHVLNGGLGSKVAQVVGERYPVPMGFVGINDTYAESGEPEALLVKYGLMPDDVVKSARKTLQRKKNAHTLTKGKPDIMNNKRKVDTILVGTGQGGVPLAEKLAKDGQRVVVLERGPWGGTCLNYGCTPSKMLLASAHAANNARQASKLGVHAQVKIDFPEVMERIRATSQSWSDGVATRLEKAGATLIQEEASFVASKTVAGGDHVIEADTVIINTGKSPFIPPIQGLGGSPYLTYESIWDIEALPHRMVIIGAGYVGVELGQAFAQLGSEVHIIASHERPLSREAAEVGQLVTEQLEEDGVRFYFKNRAEEVQYENGIFHVGIPGGDLIEGEALLIATGRKPNTINLNPSRGKIKLDQNGHILVDEQFHTTAEGVYAIGDVTGQPAFTHVSWEDHRRMLAILNGQDRARMDRILGYTIFTQPQIGRAGLSLSQAQKEGYNARQVKLPLEKVARATEVGFTRGFYQMVIDNDTDKILGATLVSPGAGELIHVFIAHMEAGSTWQVLESSVHIHPTFAEGLPSLARMLKE